MERKEVIKQALEACKTDTIQLTGFAIDRLVYMDKRKLPLKPSLKIVNKSPAGFNWGYGGSGPAQLSAAILNKFFKTNTLLHKAIVLELYQDFKNVFIATLPQGSFEATIHIKKWLKRLLNEEKCIKQAAIKLEELMQVKENSNIEKIQVFTGSKMV